MYVKGFTVALSDIRLNFATLECPVLAEAAKRLLLTLFGLTF